MWFLRIFVVVVFGLLNSRYYNEVCNIGTLTLRLWDLFQKRVLHVLTGCPLTPLSPFLPWSPAAPHRPFNPEAPLSPGSPDSPYTNRQKEVKNDTENVQDFFFSVTLTMCIFYLFTRWTSFSRRPRWSHVSSGTWSTNEALLSSHASLTLTANQSWCRSTLPLITLRLSAHPVKVITLFSQF